MCVGSAYIDGTKNMNTMFLRVESYVGLSSLSSTGNIKIIRIIIIIIATELTTFDIALFILLQS